MNSFVASVDKQEVLETQKAAGPEVRSSSDDDATTWRPKDYPIIVILCHRLGAACRRGAKGIARFSIFRYVGSVLTVGNLLLLASDHYPTDQRFQYYIEIGNFIFLLLFAIEMTIKVLSKGMKRYWR